MNSWFQSPTTSSSRDALVFVAGAALGAGALLYYTSKESQKVKSNVQSDVFSHGDEDIDHSQLQAPPSCRPIKSSTTTKEHANGYRIMEEFDTDDILKEQLTRNVQFFGLEGQKNIARAFVVVVGLGGVGSHCAHLLLRSGVGHLRLVDFDQVTLSSLNRHCLATRADVGLPKATCLHRHFKEILPEADVEALCEMYTKDTEDMVLSPLKMHGCIDSSKKPDYVIDAIDNIDTKVALLAACKERGIPVLCVAGAGAKADPTRVRFLDISQSAVDPLARAVRHQLRKEYGIDQGITVLLSNEKPRCGLIYGGEEGTDMYDYQVIPNFRIRTIPVLGTTPAVFGLAAAGHVLCRLADQPFESEPAFRLPQKAIQTQYDRYEQREFEKYGVSADALGADEAEVEVLIREVYRGASIRSGPPGSGDYEIALTRGLGNLVLTRWDVHKSGTIDNLVLLTREEADAHDAVASQPGGLEVLAMREPEFVAKVQRALSRARRDFKYAYY